MKCWIPEIFWHDRDPVLSVDIQPRKGDNCIGFYRLASGGTNTHVLIWRMEVDDVGSIKLDLAADLTKHQRAVNVVRWSPSGEFLATGDDESVIYIWTMKGENDNTMIDETEEQNKEDWVIHKILRGHIEDVYDISWSPDENFLISGSVDNTAIVWDFKKGKSVQIIDDHKGFVQGVAWDPKNQYLTTLSADRYFRVFDVETRKTLSRSYKGVVSLKARTDAEKKPIRLFHDDTLQSYFRRLCFSPDGLLIVTPAGVIESETEDPVDYVTYIYSRHSLSSPAIVLQSLDQFTVAAKFSPLLYKLRPHNENNLPIINLPYRMIVAVATKNSVYLYDTQQTMPFLLIANVHYTRLTDLTWSIDGRVLVASSTDGFCSIITFQSEELGEVYVPDKNYVLDDSKEEATDQNEEKTVVATTD